MNTTSPAPLAGRVVWNGKDLEQSGAWVRQWPAGAAEAIDAAWSHAKSKGLKETAIRRQERCSRSVAEGKAGVLIRGS